MRMDATQKITVQHLRQNAYLYIRQSTMRQVFENTESTERQYALRQRAIALGWSAEQVVVIDCDLGQSGASTADREGFKKLVAEVGMGHAGIVMGLEVSRLARNSTDWHRLLEICALTDTLILDEDGVYDPAHFNDRLLLGLKGTMSEAELHVLKARLQGGILNKARRGELESGLPMGYVYDTNGRVVLDPDQRVQESLRHFFATFRRTGSALGVVKAFGSEGLSFPRRVRNGPDRGTVVWGPLLHTRALRILHNPRYAGAFFYGRTKQHKDAQGKVWYEKLPMEEWTALIPGMHEGYISWEEFEANQRRLGENAAFYNTDRSNSPPREGPALLQGLVVCGRCGERMTLRYHHRGGREVPTYLCQQRSIEHGRPVCQQISGEWVDQAVGELLLELVTPLSLEVALTVEQELKARLDEVDRLCYKEVESARYHAELARRRYMQVDPENRLVADELEADWNHKLRAYNEALDKYEKRKQVYAHRFNEEQRSKIMALATDFPRLWKDPNTPQRERKRMIRLLIEDVTLLKDQQIIAHVRLKGGTNRTLHLARPVPAWKMRQTDSEVVAEIDRLLDHHTEEQISSLLTERGFTSGMGKVFHRRMVLCIIRAYKLKTRYQRLRDAGMLTADEVSSQLGVSLSTVKIWRRAGLLRACVYNDNNQCLYEPPGADAPEKFKHKGIYDAQRRPRKLASNRKDEVQCEA